RKLDGGICDRLVRALLLLTGNQDRRGLFVERRPTDNAEYAFVLLADYCEQLGECRKALASITPEGLGNRLRLGQRISKPSSENLRLAALSLLKGLSKVWDWRDYFSERELVGIEKILNKYEFFSESAFEEKQSSIVNIWVYPPPAL